MALTKVTSSMTEGGDDLQTDIALLGFKVAANGSLAAYGLSKQTIDAFEDASGIDAGASTDEIRNASNYYSGVNIGSLLNAYTSGSGTWTCPAGVTSVEVLVVAGGGGGGGLGGGGGAGGVVHHTGKSVTPSTGYSYSVGSGGSGGTYNNSASGSAGGNSTFDTITALGGGKGSNRTDTGYSGGSGGGGNGGYSTVGGSATQGDSGGGTGYGNDGGNGVGGAYYGGGGGGAETAGGVGNSPSGYTGAGGSGKYFANFDSYGTNSSNAKPTADGSGSGKGYFGGGGSGGGGSTVNAGTAGVGGGGTGDVTAGKGGNGLANTGGGGGGAGNTTSYTGGTGGSGIVLIRESDSANNMTLVSNASTADSAPDKADIVMTYTNGAGTATINTDLKAYVSRDGGTTWTQATLVADGTSGGHSILVAHNIDISSQPSGTSMKYKIETLNQSASKETRIQAVSLGWK
jgi:hypothetical protein